MSNYSVFDVEATHDERVRKVVGMVEKPAFGDVPSNLVATGRYLLDRAIFGALPRITPGKGGELQLIDAIELLISGCTPSMSWSMMESAMTSAILPVLFPPASSSAAAIRSTVRLSSPTWRSCWRSIGVSWGRGGILRTKRGVSVSWGWPPFPVPYPGCEIIQLNQKCGPCSLWEGRCLPSLLVLLFRYGGRTKWCWAPSCDL